MLTSTHSHITLLRPAEDGLEAKNVKHADKDMQKNGEEQQNTGLLSPIPVIDKEQSGSHDPYQAFRFRDFRLLFVGTFISSVGEQMVSVAIGWELYDRTGSALVLGGVGLVQVIPVLLLSLPAGHLADRLNRKLIVFVSQVMLALTSVGLLVLSFTHGALLLIFGCLFLMGCAMAFNSPASTTLLPQAVPEYAFGNAATWESSSWQLASVLGPATGGLIIALSSSATMVYGLNAGAALVFAVLVMLMRAKWRTQAVQEVERVNETTFRSLLEGIKFLRSTQVILAAITLDLFAVLLGGATTLLPIYAKDILHVGPTGLGWLRAAPSIGAVGVSIALAHLPPFRKAGRVLLLAVAGFGIGTCVFGLSHSFWLSLLMLCILGGLDNVSVVIRHTLLLTRVPDAMRGRIAAVNTLFIGASNQLGGFESGLVAQLFGPVLSVAGGGVGTILVVIMVALLWPEMRRLGYLSE